MSTSNELPTGYVVQEHPPGLHDESGRVLRRYQPLREWKPGHTEALYWSNRLTIATFMTCDAAVRFARRHAESGCDEHLALYCSVCPSIAYHTWHSPMSVPSEFYTSAADDKPSAASRRSGRPYHVR